MMNTVALACVAAVALASSASAFPGRAGASSLLWCPEAARAAGLDPVLKLTMTEGPHAYGDSGVPENTPPPWMDAKKAAAGRLLVQLYPMGVVFAHIQALYMILAVPSVLDVLVYTGQSDTPDKAWYRYLDTVTGVGSWYASDAYQPGSWGFEELRRVRGMHRHVREDMNEDADQDAVRNRTRLGGDFSGCPASAAMRRDLGQVADAACPFANLKRSPDNANTIDGEDGADRPRLWMSQYDMAMTQWAFVGPVVMFPDKFGMANVTDELLDGFVHLWEVLGYSLGIEDRFNMCQGGLAATRQRAFQALSAVVLPQLRLAQPPWEYMARCMADGLAYSIPGADFNVQLETMLRDTLDAPVPSVAALLSPVERTSLRGFRDIMSALRKGSTRSRPAWPATLAPSDAIKSGLRPAFKDVVRRLRHRDPHRSQDCFAEIRT